MTLFQIAIRNLNRRRGKMFFMLIGLSIASAAVVSIFTIIMAMQEDISRQLSDMGANIVITANSEALSFQYGGITIPELIFDAATLSENDLESIENIPDSEAIIAAAPKLIGTFEHKIHHLIITGSDLPAVFAVKPWLRFHEEHPEDEEVWDSNTDGSIEELPIAANETGAADELMEMDYQALNLERMKEVAVLADNEVVLGSKVAAMLELSSGDKIELNDKEYTVVAVLETNGMAEDNQLFMSLAEAQNLLDRTGELTVIEVAADFNLVGEDVLLGQLKNALPHASVSGVRQAVMGRNELLSSFYRFGLLTGGLISLCGLLFVTLTMSAAVRERTREIGIFRAIGFRGKTIFKIITMETLLLSAFAGIAGYHGGLFTARLIAPLLTGSILNSSWQTLPFITALTATALAGGLAGIYPAFKAARLDPAEALRFI